MNTKHTPGPWTLCPSSHSGLAISNAEDGAFKVPRATLALCGKSRTTAEEWHYIAAMNDHEQAEADARLIAAAPELLAALRAWVESTAFDEQTGSMRAVYEAARAAIDKATGGAA